MDSPQGAAADGEVLAERRDRAAVDIAHAGDHTVAGHGFALHAEVMAVMLGMQAPLHEGILFEKCGDAVARSHEAFLAAFGKFLLAAGSIGGAAFLLESREQCFGYGHDKILRETRLQS